MTPRAPVPSPHSSPSSRFLLCRLVSKPRASESATAASLARSTFGSTPTTPSGAPCPAPASPITPASGRTRSSSSDTADARCAAPPNSRVAPPRGSRTHSPNGPSGANSDRARTNPRAARGEPADRPWGEWGETVTRHCQPSRDWLRAAQPVRPPSGLRTDEYGDKYPVVRKAADDETSLTGRELPRISSFSTEPFSRARGSVLRRFERRGAPRRHSTTGRAPPRPRHETGRRHLVRFVQPRARDLRTAGRTAR